MRLSSYKKLSPDQMPKGFTIDGAYAGISDDDGKTWRIRRLTGGNVLGKDGKPAKVQTVSYVTACQSPDGMLHAISSHNHPDLHYEFNETWVLQGSQDPVEIASEFDVNIKPGTVKKYHETYPNGKLKVSWSAGTGEDGNYLLDGIETWYYQNGQKRWQSDYKAGQKTGTETYFSIDGKKLWQKVYTGDGTYDWTLYDEQGKEKARSTWQGKKLLDYKLSKS